MNTPLKIAIIADSPEDRSLLSEALAKVGSPKLVTRQSGANEAESSGLESFQPQVALLAPGLSDERVDQLCHDLENVVLLRVVRAGRRSSGPQRPVNLQEIQLADLEPAPLRRALERAVAKKAENRLQRRVLIIDDSIDDQELYSRALAKVQTVDYHIKTASSGETGLDAIQSFKPNCLLLDYSLPGRDGLDILNDIRENHPFLPVVFLTGYGNDRIAVEAMRSGAQDYLTKSNVSKELLHQAIQNACERQALQQRVKSQQETLTLFTRALAHDLKEPLRSVRSFCQLATSSGDLNPATSEYLDFAISAVDHMDRLVDTVRAFTSLQDEQDPSELTRFPAKRAVDQALKNLQQQLNEVPHEIDIGELPDVRGDEAQIVSLFQNLISNALNYGDKPVTRIQIHGKPTDEGNVFTVSDNGSGIESSFALRIFKPFKRLSDGRRKGSGLGLSICQKIVERHHGRIWLEPEPDKGAVFRFILPKVEQSTTEQDDDNAETGEATSDNLRTANVLHVEDNPTDVLLTKLMLLKRDHVELNIYNVTNGQDALTFLADDNNPRIDLILLDINMPIMDGFEFLRHFKNNGYPSDVPVIVCSTSDDRSDQRNARELGAQGYVIKPINLANLEPAIRTIPSFVLRRQDECVRLEVAR